MWSSMLLTGESMLCMRAITLLGAHVNSASPDSVVVRTVTLCFTGGTDCDVLRHGWQWLHGPGGGSALDLHTHPDRRPVQTMSVVPLTCTVEYAVIATQVKVLISKLCGMPIDQIPGGPTDLPVRHVRAALEHETCICLR
jgi:hypothetical protein